MAELDEFLFVRHVTPNPLTAWEPFVTIWVCAGRHSPVGNIAEWQQVLMGEAQAGEADERPAIVHWIQNSRTAKLPKEGTLGETLGIRHVSNVPLDDWEPFITAWACTGFFPLSPYAQWQQLLLGDVKLSE
ncbi:hypothetical protein ACFYZ5_42175 [Streptomyces chartreusis]|uniref:hypothetical protein n=1 Tax=Streptomyces chartreusis TaxID=1969 RepID=UPI0036AFD6A7